ncbi:hypothetical protein Q4Q39_15980 [Flavivirga amylovorans]|uniref:Uncharacterized protein n=1 Tax=Flavivirga amylovorans TaxID=870486 RepID=A0ABT8X4N0_9FLAO|nr:hypothetical protein [Flavivirga amylovorans]MDO5988909.1 hypothetical protein [Flavivirga amylovorans]
MKKNYIITILFKTSQKPIKIKALHLLYTVVFVQISTIVLGVVELLRAALFI